MAVKLQPVEARHCVRKPRMAAYYLLLGISTHLGAMVFGVYPTQTECLAIRSEMLTAQRVGPSFKGTTFACYRVTREREASVR